jgi:hypothetical protein
VQTDLKAAVWSVSLCAAQLMVAAERHLTGLMLFAFATLRLRVKF